MHNIAALARQQHWAPIARRACPAPLSEVLRFSRQRLESPQNPVAGYTLFLATVDQSKYVRLAEKWLIRLLWTADELNTPRVMQNIKDTKSKLRVNKGDTLSITHDGNLPPFFRQTVYTYNGPKNI